MDNEEEREIKEITFESFKQVHSVWFGYSVMSHLWAIAVDCSR